MADNVSNNPPSENPTLSDALANSQFIPLPESAQVSKTVTSGGEDFKSRAKALESAAGSLWSIPNGICIRVLRNRLLRAGAEEDKADEISEMARISPESFKAAKEATARIIARRGMDEEVMDWIIVSGAAADMATGFYDCLTAIKSLEKTLAKKAA